VRDRALRSVAAVVESSGAIAVPNLHLSPLAVFDAALKRGEPRLPRDAVLVSILAIPSAGRSFGRIVAHLFGDATPARPKSV
jgi:hypothetical protein